MTTPTHSLAGCWFLTGATASGKTTIGIELAQHLDAEIISLDSMAIYRGMDIGTAKPTRQQRQAVPHHLLDIRDPHEQFSLANYVALAGEVVGQIRSRGKEVVFVGGTPLYLKALLRGIFDGPAADWEFRRQIEDEVQQVGVAALHDRLKQVDPLSASKLPASDVRRIVRALEVYKITGKPISHWQMQFDEGVLPEDRRVFVLRWSRADLHCRIEARVDEMFRRGLLDEVRSLCERYGELSRTASQAVGYREVLEHLRGDYDLEQTIDRVKARTRRFAKRQGTWFRAISECRFVPRSRGQGAKDVAAFIAASGSS